MDLEVGSEHYVNGLGDLYFDRESRPFIRQRVVVLKKTKAGLYQIALISDRKKTYSLPKRNLDPAFTL